MRDQDRRDDDRGAAWGVLESGARWALAGGGVGAVLAILDGWGLGGGTPPSTVVLNTLVLGSLFAGPGVLFGLLRRLPLQGLSAMTRGRDGVERALLGAFSGGVFGLGSLLADSGIEAFTRPTGWMGLTVFAGVGLALGVVSPRRAAPDDRAESAALPRSSAESILGGADLTDPARKKAEAHDV